MAQGKFHTRVEYRNFERRIENPQSFEDVRVLIDGIATHLDEFAYKSNQFVKDVSRTAAQSDNVETSQVEEDLGTGGGGGSGAAHEILSTTHTDTAISVKARGGILIVDNLPQWKQLAIGASGTFLRSDGNDPSWQNVAASDITDFTEAAQDAVGAMVDTTLVYVDGTPLLTRAALTGDVTAPQASNVTTLATVNIDVGVWGSATAVGAFAVNGKGLITAAANVTITPAVSSLTGRTDLAGTANQITLSASGVNALVGGTNITLSLPQDIHTAATPQFAKLGLGAAAGTAVLEVTGNALATGYLRVGSLTAPSNTTAGDLSVQRIFIGNSAVANKRLLIW